MTPKTLRDLGLALLLAIGAAVLGTKHYGLPMGAGAGVALLAVGAIWELVQRLRGRRKQSPRAGRPVRVGRSGDVTPGDRVRYDWGLDEEEGTYMGLAPPPLRPKLRIQRDSGEMVILDREIVRHPGATGDVDRASGR